MIESVARWIVRGVSLLLLGPVAAWAAGGVRAGDGSQAATLLTGGAMPAGLVGLVIVGLCVIAAGGLAARLCDRHEGVLNAGFVMGWVAWTAGRLGDAYRLDPEAGTLVRVALEGSAMLAIVAMAMLVADRFSRRSSQQEGLGLSGSDIVGALRLKTAVPAMGASLGLSLLLAWLFARHDAPGQALGAAFLCGLGAGVFGSLVSQSLAPEVNGKKTGLPGVTASFVPIATGVMLAGVVGPLFGLGVPGAGKLLSGVARGDLPGWILVSPAAWATGALIGVPAGISFLQPKQAIEVSGLSRSA